MCSGRIFKGSHHQTAPTALSGARANFRRDSQADYFLLLLNPAISLYGKGRTELLNNSGWRNCWRSSGPHGNVTVPLFPDSKILRSIITLKATAQTPPRSLRSIQPSITALVCQGETMRCEALQPKGISRLRQSAPQHSVVWDRFCTARAQGVLNAGTQPCHSSFPFLRVRKAQRCSGSRHIVRFRKKVIQLRCTFSSWSDYF